MADRIAARPDWAEAQRRFSIEAEEAGLAGDLRAGLNACVECCDRHCGENRLALRCVSATGALAEYTFEDLRHLAGQAANLLRDKGVRPGDVVAGMLPRRIELVADPHHDIVDRQVGLVVQQGKSVAPGAAEPQDEDACHRGQHQGAERRIGLLRGVPYPLVAGGPPECRLVAVRT